MADASIALDIQSTYVRSQHEREPITLSYRYRLLPTRQQHAALARILEDQRQLYNACLAERIDAYQRSLLEIERHIRAKPHSITYFDQTNSLTKCRQALPEMAAVPAFLQHWTLKKLDDAYKAFFSRVKKGTGKAGFPRFRGRDYWQSFGFSQNGGFRFDGRRLRMKGLPGGLRLKLHRPLPGDIGALGHRSDRLRSIVLTREGRRWMIALQCYVEPIPRCQSLTAAVGIDVGLSALIAQSDGVLIPAPQPARRASKAMRRAQRALSRAKRGSIRRAKTRERLARLHRQVANTRATKLHTQAARLTRSYAVIAAEDLAIRNMSRSAAGTVDNPGRNVAAKSGLNRSIGDASWGRLRTLIAYKAARDGSTLVTVDPRYTSQTCPECGAIAPKTLAERVHRCDCGCVLDRDVAAAKVILSAALAAADPGLPVRAGANGAVGRRRLRNTAGASLPDGGSNPASTYATAQSETPGHGAPRRRHTASQSREPQASRQPRGDPRDRDTKQLALDLPLSPASGTTLAAGPRNRAGSPRRSNGLQPGRRTSRGSMG